MSVNVQCGVKWGVTVLMGAVLAACGGGGGTPATTVAGGGTVDTTSGTGTTVATTTTGGSTTGTTTGTSTTTTTTGTGTTSGTGSTTTGTTSGTTTGSTSTGTTTTTTTTTTGSGTTSSGTGTGSTTTGTTTATAPCTLFPATAVFNTPINTMPVHAQSETWKALVGNTVPFHPDWGNSEDQSGGAYYGIPTNTVNGTSLSTTWPQVTWTDVTDESDCATQNTSGGYDILRGCTSANLAGKVPRFPFPAAANTKFEGGTCTSNCGDRHVLIIETAQCRLWEAASVYNVNGVWSAYGGVAWNLRSLDMRPDTWTSADAAGLPIAPLLVKAAEASTEIKHALRVTLQDRFIADRLYTWPASHRAGGSGGVIPMGAAMRLKATFVPPSTWNAQSKALVLAMQRYGLYVADNGSNMFVQGEPSVNWNDKVFDELKTLKMADFEFVDLSPITTRTGFNPRSYAASW